MTASSLKFGTSGVRGLVTELEGQPARRYVAAFLAHLAASGLSGSGQVLVGRDLRPSSPDIARDCMAAIAAAGMTPVDCGDVPTPALALQALATDSAAIMVTGSHIPADRNGLKFYTPRGEISKDDEQGIVGRLSDAVVPDLAVEPAGQGDETRERYARRFAELIEADALKGMRIGVFQHSTVARDMLGEILAAAGARPIPLWRSAAFVPVDTEAFGDAIFAPLPHWVREYQLDAIVSADGDADRPLVVDDKGKFVRGDVLGLLAARFVGAKVVVTPVTSNSAIEQLGFEVVRTRVGSPYVVAGMDGVPGVAGFEANGGTFVGEGLSVGGRPLAALPTRDAVLPILAVLSLAAAENKPISELVSGLPLRVALADRVQEVPAANSSSFLERMGDDEFASAFFAPRDMEDVSRLDGLKFQLAGGETVHFRASGNAPELRCYVEAPTTEQASLLLAWAMEATRAALK